MFAVLLLLVTQTPPSPQPRVLVSRAVAAMGGEAALRGLRTLSVEFYTATYALGQEEWPGGPARASFAIGRTDTDYAGMRQAGAIELRSPLGSVTRLRRVTAGGVGMLVTNDRQAPDNPAPVAAAERGLRRALERVLLAALDNPNALRAIPARGWRGAVHDGVRYTDERDTVEIFFDRDTRLPIFTHTLSDDPILGDRRTITAVTRWQEVPEGGGLLYPRQLDVEINGRPQTHSVFTAVTVNPVLPDSLFAIPDSIRARAQPAGTERPPVTVTLAELAPGVWRAEGGSHHSLVVDQGGRLLIVEAPQGAERMQAVLDTVRSRLRKPVDLVVNTHHHWDHAGGLRTAVVNGIPLATHVVNLSFVQGVAVAGKTVNPDLVDRTDRRVGITGVRDSLVHGTGETRVVMYALPTAHVQGMLVAYVPSARLLFQSDIISAGANMSRWGSAELVRLVRARGIAVERVAGGHGGVAAWADVERAAAP